MTQAHGLEPTQGGTFQFYLGNSAILAKVAYIPAPYLPERRRGGQCLGVELPRASAVNQAGSGDPKQGNS